MVSFELNKRTDELTNRNEFIGPIYSGGPINQQKIKTRIRNNVVHVHYCESQFNQKNIFHSSFKIIPFHYIEKNPLTAPSNYMKQSPHFSSHFGKICYLVFKDL